MRPSRLQKPTLSGGGEAKDILLLGLRASRGREEEQKKSSRGKEQSDKEGAKGKAARIGEPVSIFKRGNVYWFHFLP